MTDRLTRAFPRVNGRLYKVLFYAGTCLSVERAKYHRPARTFDWVYVWHADMRRQMSRAATNAMRTAMVAVH